MIQVSPRTSCSTWMPGRGTSLLTWQFTVTFAMAPLDYNSQSPLPPSNHTTSTTTTSIAHAYTPTLVILKDLLINIMVHVFFVYVNFILRLHKYYYIITIFCYRFIFIFIYFTRFYIQQQDKSVIISKINHIYIYIIYCFIHINFYKNELHFWN